MRVPCGAHYRLALPLETPVFRLFTGGREVQALRHGQALLTYRHRSLARTRHCGEGPACRAGNTDGHHDALVAALVPVILAVAAVVAAFGSLGPISQVLSLDDSVKTVVQLIGMAVGVDYALFYVVRLREERLRGASTCEEFERTSRTSGRSVLVAEGDGAVGGPSRGYAHQRGGS